MLLICSGACAQLVVGVPDADTYKILMNGRTRMVRLAHVDAPENNQHFGKVATDCVANLILGRQVQLEPQGTDLYGRMIAVVFFQGMRIDSLLLVRGWAWFYTAYSNLHSYSLYQAAAKERGLGLWACPQAVPP